MALIYVVAIITGREDSKEQLGKELSAVVPLVRGEEGCLRYDLHRSAEGAPSFMFYETWQSKEALAVHLEAPNLKKMRERIKDLVTGPPQVSLWSALEVA